MEMVAELVSIIIPCFNQEQHVAEAICSALSQTYSPIEIIVVDDGSTDDSLSVIKSFGDRIVRIEQTNRGAPAARNAALAEASGRYIKFLDADDVLYNCIAEQVTQLRDLRDNELPVGESVYLDDHGRYSLRKAKFTPVWEEPVSSVIRVATQSSLPLHRSEYLLQAQGFDESLPRAQEYDLHLRLYLNGIRFRHFETKVSCIRISASPSRISNQKEFVREPAAALERIKAREALIRERYASQYSRQVRAALAFSARENGRMLIDHGLTRASKTYFEYAESLDPNFLFDSFKLHEYFSRTLGFFESEMLRGRLRQAKRSLGNIVHFGSEIRRAR